YTVIYANPQAQQLLQIKPDPVFGYTLMDHIKRLISQNDEKIDDHTTNELVVNKRVFMLKHVPFSKGQSLASHIFLLRDVTELRNKEKELMVKAAVIKEIHHRVKNNLYTVVSILELQMRRSHSKKVNKALLSGISRISSMALIHEVLVAEDIHCIDMIALIEKVANLSIQTAAYLSDSVKVNISGETAYLPSEIATGTAMVLNELIQNAIEHGFKDSRNGIINIEVCVRDQYITITVSDNGCGVPEDFNILNCAGLGLNIVYSMVKEKLGGQIEFSGVTGTTAKFSFPIPEDSQ
ncbi:MAG: sensor histidine kinase, partial [Eubacteriales bacterium]